MIETWKPIKGYEGVYEVSDWGRVKRILPQHGATAGKLLTITPKREGRCAVSLSSHNKIQHRRVHRLVAEAFIGPCPPGKEVNHIDGNPANNHVSNLEYVTRAENLAHERLHSRRRHWTRGEEHLTSKLTNEAVKAIRREPERSSAHFAAVYGVSRQTVLEARRGNTWKHVQ